VGCLAVLGTAGEGRAQPADKVQLQLKWVPQAQFAVTGRSLDLHVGKRALQLIEQTPVVTAMPFHQDPMPLFVDISGERKIVIVEEAQIQRQEGIGMIYGSAFDHDVSCDGEFLQIILPCKALHLLFPLLLHRNAVFRPDVQLASLGLDSR